MRLARVLLVPVCTAALVAPVIAGPGDAATPPLKFGKWFVDLPGTDKATAANLNKEYIVVTNTTTKAISLKGYRVRDYKAKHTYTFGTFTLGAKKSVTLHTGSGKNNATNVYWNQRNFVWNNDGDTAQLLNTKSQTVASCKYVKLRNTSKTGGWKNC
ncbi:lamin tail domain-containing protein [Branchiibius cervicis]|uniref:Lamin tail domain-containing protein n=1 Tax=Branchiibius cervicis TaxID=908252 RepID=A0ABW2ATS2_9MICO